MKGQLITIEGISGVGKTHIFDRIKENCKTNDIVFNSEITDSVHLGYNKMIYDILASSNSRFFDTGNPKMETLLIAAKLANDEENILIPALNEGKTVVSDRGYDTMCIIQGILFSLKYNSDLNTDIEDLYCTLKKYCKIPDKTILLIDNFNKCIKRAENRDCVKYSEKEKYILSKSYEYFIKMASKHKERFYVLNVGDLNEKQIIEKILEIINV